MPSTKLLANLGALCNMVKRVAREAGDTILMNYFDESGGCQVDIKPDGSPVTFADRAAEDFIREALARITPDIAFVGEETADMSGLETQGAPYFWLVDALDGTRQFVAGDADFSVNIALIKDGVPILGVVYAPAKGELYAGHGPLTAVRWLEETGLEKSIMVRKSPKAGLTVMTGKDRKISEKFDEFLSQFKVEKVIKRGSSLKLCAISAGKADLYPRFGPTCEWDTAAGDAILRAAGGMVTDMNGKALVYGKGQAQWLNPEFVASAFVWFEEDKVGPELVSEPL